ncbi:unnamed protein product [Paramecium sonneborni]|uniref:Uncharacterized protein n=1 Tax=Paramecium sonneborni TaxID=65129 RepID=A0A8S1KW23_9CILI|nr:unnamed protein product [Paramecium sonneborni]
MIQQSLEQVFTLESSSNYSQLNEKGKYNFEVVYFVDESQISYYELQKNQYKNRSRWCAICGNYATLNDDLCQFCKEDYKKIRTYHKARMICLTINNFLKKSGQPIYFTINKNIITKQKANLKNLQNYIKQNYDENIQFKNYLQNKEYLKRLKENNKMKANPEFIVYFVEKLLSKL